MEEKPKFDNFYSPQNVEFYANFRYAELTPWEKEFRLLRLHPAQDFADPISCDLIDKVPLSKRKHQYKTISYVAGDPKKTEAVLVNGQRFNAFANLALALRQVRSFFKTTGPRKGYYLWADQICINQSNPQERSHQVGMMRDIYLFGKRVFVSLSKGNDTGGGLEFLLYIHQKFGKLLYRAEFRLGQPLKDSPLYIRQMSRRLLFRSDFDPINLDEALTKLLFRGKWTD